MRSFVPWSRIEAHSPWVSTVIFAPQNQPRVEKAWCEEFERSVSDGFTQAEVDNARVRLLGFRRLSCTQDTTVVAAGRADFGETVP